MKTLILALSLALPWTSGGPHGGFVGSLASAPSNPRVVYAAGKGGVFRTDDNGATWRDVSPAIRSVRSVVVDPHDPDTAYAIAAGDIRPAYRTNDGGATWTVMNVGLKRINTIVVDPNDGRTLYASADCGSFFEPLVDGAGAARSTDGGRTWVRAMNGINGWPCVSGLSLDPANASHLFAKTDYDVGAWESFNGASTWTRAAHPLPTREVVIDPYQPSVRYGTNGNEVLRSDDGGVSWTRQPATGIPNVSTEQRHADLSLDPVTPRIFSATPAGLFRSGDGGRSWAPAGDAPQIRVNGVAFNELDATVMIGTSQGVFRAPSPMFGPWTQLDVPESGMLLEQIVADPRQPSIAYASSSDEPSGMPQGRIFRSRDAGVTWERIGGRFGGRARLAVDASGDLWFANRFSTTLQRVPAGTNEVTPVAQQFPPLVTIAAHPEVAGLVYAGSDNGEVLRTSDAGATWTRCRHLFYRLAELAVHPSGAIFAATGDGILRSTDGCATVQMIDGNPADGIALAPSNPSVLHRLREGAAARSEDGGATWKAITLPFPIQEIAVSPDDDRRLWLASVVRGVWESSDGGVTWSDVSETLPGRSALTLAINADGSILHAGTVYHGVWELRLRGRQRAVRRR